MNRCAPRRDPSHRQANRPGHDRRSPSHAKRNRSSRQRAAQVRGPDVADAQNPALADHRLDELFGRRTSRRRRSSPPNTRARIERVAARGCDLGRDVGIGVILAPVVSRSIRSTMKSRLLPDIRRRRISSCVRCPALTASASHRSERTETIRMFDGDFSARADPRAARRLRTRT